MSVTKESIVLDLDFHCTSASTNSLGRRKIKFDANSPPVIAGDLINKIEEEIQIPATAMTLQIHSVPLRRHTDDLKWFKLRTGDTVTVHYYSDSDCKEVNECIDLLGMILLELQNYIASTSADRQLQFPLTTANGISMFHSVCISKWLDPRSYANKVDFIHREGLQIISKILQCIAEVEKKPYKPSVLYSLLSIENSLLDCLWDLTEDDYIREQVTKSGGVDNCLNILNLSRSHTRIVKALGVIAK